MRRQELDQFVASTPDLRVRADHTDGGNCATAFAHRHGNTVGNF
jgi:hypothetical protein